MAWENTGVGHCSVKLLVISFMLFWQQTQDCLIPKVFVFIKINLMKCENLITIE